MRITHSRVEDVYSVNIEIEAHKEWTLNQSYEQLPNSTRTTKAESYRNQLNSIFTPYVWPGGYPKFFCLDDSTWTTLCNTCAKEVFLEERVTVTSDIHYAGPNIQCDECQREIPSAYGDPNKKETK